MAYEMLVCLVNDKADKRFNNLLITNDNYADMAWCTVPV